MNGETPLPKQELLIKLLKLTTSSNDGEALSAIRKANALLASASWDWEKLIHGKIKVIEDPFKSISVPQGRNDGMRGTVPDRPYEAPPPPQPTRAPKPYSNSYNPNRREQHFKPTPPPPPSKDDFLRSQGINPNDAGSTRFPGTLPVTGNTYSVKDKLKALGAKWDKIDRVWRVPTSRHREAAQIVAKANRPVSTSIL